jgi:hypothetical protein
VASAPESWPNPVSRSIRKRHSWKHVA